MEKFVQPFANLLRLPAQREHAVDYLSGLVSDLKKKNVESQPELAAAGATVVEVPLVVQEAVPLAGLFGRAWDSIRLWIK